MNTVAAAERIAAGYRRFAEVEAPGRSPLYARLAHEVADDAEVLAFLSGLPEAKWQPQVLLRLRRAPRSR
jgi:Uncharacterized protein conserved in bacteria (DUF2332)